MAKIAGGKNSGGNGVAAICLRLATSKTLIDTNFDGHEKFSDLQDFEVPIRLRGYDGKKPFPVTYSVLGARAP